MNGYVRTHIGHVLKNTWAHHTPDDWAHYDGEHILSSQGRSDDIVKVLAG